MSEKRHVREYVDDFDKYFSERWAWSLKNSIDQHDLYMSTRARRSTNPYQGNVDLLPDFYSIERDAAQFDLEEVEWQDFFGLVWEGKKGVIARAGAPNFQGNLYYYDPDNVDDEFGYCVSEIYDAHGNQPQENIYVKTEHRGITRWIDTANAIDIRYKYIVDNHLFKDTWIEIIYEDGEVINIWGDYKTVIDTLLHQGKENFVGKILKTMNEHFIKLRDSEREEFREFYPGKTAEEMFLGDDEE